MFEFWDWGVTGGEERGVGMTEVMVFEVDTKFLFDFDRPGFHTVTCEKLPVFLSVYKVSAS